jgi:hypothetical protein
MEIITFIYLFILFVVFSPGILFSIPSFIPSTRKSKWIQVCIHGFLFSVVWLLTHTQVYHFFNNFKEGATVIANEKSITSSTPETIKPSNIKNQKTAKCYDKKFCVATIPNLTKPDKTNYLCLGKTNGCKWEGDCKTDADCSHYNIKTSAKYMDDDPICSDKKSGWADWACKNA